MHFKLIIFVDIWKPLENFRVTYFGLMHASGTSEVTVKLCNITSKFVNKVRNNLKLSREQSSLWCNIIITGYLAIFPCFRDTGVLLLNIDSDMADILGTYYSVSFSCLSVCWVEFVFRRKKAIDHYKYIYTQDKRLDQMTR